MLTVFADYFMLFGRVSVLAKLVDFVSFAYAFFVVAVFLLHVVQHIFDNDSISGTYN